MLLRSLMRYPPAKVPTDAHRASLAWDLRMHFQPSAKPALVPGLQEQKLEATELQQVYEQLTQREARLKTSQAAAAADADALRADVATREASVTAKLRAAEGTAARLDSQREQAEKSKCALCTVVWTHGNFTD